MKFSVTKEKLLDGLQQVQNVVSTRTTLPILSNVLLQASEGEIHLTTTDLDVGVRGSCEARVEKEGATTLPARRLFNIVRELPSSEIQVDVDGKNAASIRSGQSFFKILGLPEDEFPPLPKFEDAKVVTIRRWSAQDLLCHIDRRDPLRAQRRLVQFQRQQAYASSDGWATPGHGGNRTGIPAQPRSGPDYSDQSRDRIATPAYG